MLPPSIQPRGYLPRLPAEYYRGRAVVFWTHTIDQRARGWLTCGFHQVYRELLIHTATREHLVCPIYTLMPDHIHLVLMGLNPSSDQRRACTFLRTQLAHPLAPYRFQHQAYDHVFRSSLLTSAATKAFAATCAYIAANPVRAGLAAHTGDWPFTGCMVPGFPEMDPLAGDFWERFWRVYQAK